MKTIEGKANIKATVICDSISEAEVRITTYELEYPRIIHSELMTHRMLSRNAASSRAIPFAKMVEALKGAPARFGGNVSGMQDDGHECKNEVVHYEYGSPVEGTAYEAWEAAKHAAVKSAEQFSIAGFHKQVFNRLTEPFQMMKTVVTATEWANFFWLRNDVAADPTLQELARCMKEAMDGSTPQMLKDGWWHLPYVGWDSSSDSTRQVFFEFEVYPVEAKSITTEEAIKMSAARCAAVSYRNEDYGLEKCLQVYDRLVGADRKHSSALEHQATPIVADGFANFIGTWQKGLSHIDKYGDFWSGNFKGWIQHRKLIKGENYEG